ncbi:MAG: hypothetical protein PHX52_02600 [Candidatus Pacebacteria bacterium]|nr:hypothetical protein [Candidatus Paceibacterota bacterium]MDD3919450.1 hypothetical protein [Candidatus Paceibacterota bacterium]
MSKLDYKTKLYIGFLIFIFNIVLQTVCELNSIIYSLLTALAVFFLVLGLREKRFENEIKKDERTDKVAAYAGHLTFFITFLTTAILWQLNYFLNITFNINVLLGGLFFGQLAVYFIARSYYNKKI